MNAGTIETQAVATSDAMHPSRQTMKFTYANGSTPLDGYTIKRGIGIGGFGEVYFATTPAGKEVALKRIQRNLDIELRGVAHCMNLKHPNLLQLFDVKQDGQGESWVVMEYVSGPSLRDLLNQHASGLERATVDHWFGQLAAAVAHLHANGIVHRDLKPANVFADGTIVKLGDYGLSKFISGSRRVGHTESIGTFHYMAPEIARGEYGKEIDIYALGVILYELLTGRVPFDGESSHEIVMKHLTALPDLSVVPQPYREVVSLALAKAPSQRPRSVADLLHPLGLALDSQGLVRASASVPLGTASKSPVAPRPAYQADTVVDSAQMTAEEPLFRAVKSSAGSLRLWWQGLEQNPLARAAVLFVAAAVMLLNSRWLIPVLSLMVLIYVPYYILRQLILDQSPQPGPQLPQMSGSPLTLSSFPPNARIPRKLWLEMARNDLANKSTLLRSAELFGSCSTATVSLATGYGFAALVLSREPNFTPFRLTPLFWSATISLLGAWLILAMTKLWESRNGVGEGLLRRLMLLGAGCGLGLIAFLMANFLALNVDVTQAADSLAHWSQLPSTDRWSIKDSLDQPYVAAYTLHFGLLFAGLRWWRPADPLRRSRLSLWSIAVAVVVAWMVDQFVPVPQPWGMIAAGSMAAALQIAAPWTTPAARVVG